MRLLSAPWPASLLPVSPLRQGRVSLPPGPFRTIPAGFRSARGDSLHGMNATYPSPIIFVRVCQVIVGHYRA